MVKLQRRRRVQSEIRGKEGVGFVKKKIEGGEVD